MSQRDLPERTLGDYEGRVWVAKRTQREEARMTEIIADVMTRDPATVERRESTWAAARRVAAAEAGGGVGLANETVSASRPRRTPAVRSPTSPRPRATPNLEQGPRPTSMR